QRGRGRAANSSRNLKCALRRVINVRREALPDFRHLFQETVDERLPIPIHGGDPFVAAAFFGSVQARRSRYPAIPVFEVPRQALGLRNTIQTPVWGFQQPYSAARTNDLDLF